MAKGRATEDDFAVGIRRIGVLSAVAEGVRRDSPFADVTAKVQGPALANDEPPSSPDRSGPAPTPVPPTDRGVQGSPRPSNETPTSEPSLYTDPVTVPMTAEMRTRANLLAAELQRRRTDRRVRFTSNTIFRVAIEVFFQQFELLPDERVNTEDELRQLVHLRLAAGRKRTRTAR